MPISYPGKSKQGFTVLDSLIALIVISLALSALFPVFTNLIRSSERQSDALEQLLETASKRESSSWTYADKTTKNETQ